MDSVKLCAMLFALSICMALDCNWNTQYEYKGECCQICPLGEFPIQHCSINSQSVCKKCPNKNEHCFCNNTVCLDDTCSTCSPRKLCTPEEKLTRTGSFKFGYLCEACPNQTYYSKEENICKSTLDSKNLGLPVKLPGNKTHHAQCSCIAKETSPEMVVGLVVLGLISLAMLIYLCMRTAQEQRTKKKYIPTASSLKVTIEEHGCRLSKEETGVKP